LFDKPVSKKNAGTTTFYFRRATWCLSNRLGTEDGFGLHFSGVFHQIKVEENRKKAFYASRLPKKAEIREIFILISKEL
jgi:hypothetical protein